MFNNRAYTEITKAEYAQTEKALAKLDQAFKNNRMTKAMYLSRRERLVQNLERVMSAETPLALNAQEFYARDELNLSPRPTGYQDSLATMQELDGQTRKVSQSKIRQAQLQNAFSDIDNTSIMDSLQSNVSAYSLGLPSNFQSALDSVNQIQESQLLGHLNHHGSKSPPTFAGVWRDISETPAVVNSLRNLSETVQSRVEAAIANGMPVKAAENYIISNARSAGAVLTKEGYDRTRAAEIVKSVINGEISMVAAQNVVSADLREITRAVVTQNANLMVEQTINPNNSSVNTNKMTIQDIVNVRNAALDTLADPLAFQDELEWAASFVNEANNTLNQRMNQKNVITGNSANQILVSTPPAINQNNQGDGLPNSMIEQEPMAIPNKIPSTLELVQNIPSLNQNAVSQSDALPNMINQNLPENNGYAEMVRKKEEEAAKQRELELQRISQKLAENARRIEQEAAQAERNAQEAARKEAAEKARKEAALAAKKAANLAAKKAANEARRAKEAALKAQKEEEARQAQLIEQQKKKEAAEAARLQKIANNEKKKALAEAARLKKLANAEAANKQRLIEQRQVRMDYLIKETQKFFAELGPENEKILLHVPEFQKWVESNKQKFAQLMKSMPMDHNSMEYMETGNQRIINNWNAQFVIKLINEFMNRQLVTPLPSPKPLPMPPVIPKPKPVPSPIIKPKPSNTRSPAQKIANALAKLPKEKNVDNRLKQLRKSKPRPVPIDPGLIRPPNGAPPANGNKRPLPVPIDPGLLRPIAPPKARPIPPSLPPKARQPTINQIARKSKLPPPKPTMKSIEEAIKAGRRPMLGSLRSTTASGSSTSTSHDPRAKHRDDENGLGASTSTTTSSRTSGAYRFQDPRFHHRWD